MTGEACMAGGVWQGACVVEGACMAGMCMAGGMHGRGMCGRGVHGRGVCVAGGRAWLGGMRGRRDDHCSRLEYILV